MKAIITGASSGLGADFARRLSAMGYDTVLVARRRERLEAIANELPTKTEIMVLDLSKSESCVALYEAYKDDDVEIVINNAGFGLLGRFVENRLDRELEMIDLNIKALHTLTKLFLQKFYRENRGKILNVASVGGFMPGPLLAAYYATKAYVVSLTSALREEIRRDGKSIYIGSLCPGPVDTEFSSVANVSFSLKGKSSDRVVSHAVKKMMRSKGVIIPGFGVCCLAYLSRISPLALSARITYNVQKKKTEL